VKIDISKADKAAVLAALYNASHPQGMGFMQARTGIMSLEEARQAMDSGDDHAGYFTSHGGPIAGRSRIYFDYLYGRPLKIDLSSDVLDSRLYDRDNPPAMEVLKCAGLEVSEATQ
jgi:hypothetical protein